MQGACLPKCPTRDDGLRNSIGEELAKLQAARIQAGASRANLQRHAQAVKAPTKVSVTALSLWIRSGIEKKLSARYGTRSTLFFTSASYDEVVEGMAAALFSYSDGWTATATYQLATTDGAYIKSGTPFEDFPFNLSGSGAKAKKLWIIRKEDVDKVDRHGIYGADTEDHINDDVTAQLDMFESSRCVENEIQRVTNDNGKVEVGNPSLNNNAFGDMSLRSFESMLHSTKDDARTGNMFVAILHMFDGVKQIWAPCRFLTGADMIVPCMEDPVLDGAARSFIKTRFSGLCLVTNW